MVCVSCGKELAEGAAICPECGAAQIAATVAKKKKVSALSIIALILSITYALSFVGVILAIIDLAKNRNKAHALSVIALVIGGLFTLTIFWGNRDNAADKARNPAQMETEQPQLTEEEIKKQFISSCEVPGYKDVAREPEVYKNKNVKIEGEVIQVSESYSTTTLRVATADYYDDVWYVVYKPASGEKRILEDDKIIVYGVCTGVKTYTAILGSQVTIPALDARYVEIVEP